MALPTTPLATHLGAEVANVASPRLLQPTVAIDVLDALNQHGVLVFPRLDMSDSDLVEFSRLLGTVVANPTGEHEFPEIATITLDPQKTNAMLAWYRQGNFLWHIDGATDEVPQKATLLAARQVDPAGGDTEFASTYAAYEALPEAEKERISGLRVVHSFAAAQGRAHPDATRDEQSGWGRVPTRVH